MIGNTPMRRTDTIFLLLAALCLVVGMSLGIGMGLAHDFVLAPVHAHLNLVGWATLALFGLAYRGWPELAASPLARLHLALSGSGAVTLPGGIGLALLHGWAALPVLGALLSLAGALIFLVNLLRVVARPGAQAGREASAASIAMNRRASRSSPAT